MLFFRALSSASKSSQCSLNETGKNKTALCRHWSDQGSNSSLIHTKLYNTRYVALFQKTEERQRERERKSEGKRGRQTERQTEIHTGRAGAQEQNNCNQQVRYKEQEICRIEESFTHSNLPRTQCKQAFMSSVSSRNCQMHDI